MKSTLEELSPTRVKLVISVTPDELRPHIDHAYKHIAEQVNIPGFRKGKVPPPLIDQRVGREAIMEHAVNDGMDTFYRGAVEEHKVRSIGRPEVDVIEWPSKGDFSGDLQLSIEVDVRPEITLPDYAGITLTVDEAEVTDEEVTSELDELRTRFGTLITVDRPARTGDFAQIDLVATIDGVEVDSADAISYEVGSGDLIEGIDEALDTLTAGETTTFESTLLGGDNAGQVAQISVNMLAVKERELPEANDDFAQIASEFDTIDELKDSLKEDVAKTKVFSQGRQARDMLVEKLLEMVEVPVPEKLIADEVHRHLEGESRLEDDEHRAEVEISTTKSFKTQLLLDTVAENEDVSVSQEEFTQYIIQGAGQYGMDPNEFAKVLQENGQIQSIVGEVARNKALAIILGRVRVVDSAGAAVDLGAFVAVDGDDDIEAHEAAEEAADDALDEAAEDAPVAEAPKTSRAKKAAVADDSDAAVAAAAAAVKARKAATKEASAKKAAEKKAAKKPAEKKPAAKKSAKAAE
ncbi:trigger factor [Homoserinimonas sp. OAct 916]|uniref:trigger factor n=1 Tax=Homoserinimonas sp. OAct 916 TaxID=2211450 RepID=UPI000DBE249F|nr:trigger factor [Homoserinimonas sp. OAct 916]